ncbi:acetyl-CoA synthetase [Deinobacterium chartae]|uniref:Acetyl-CoA synthetase n=1 Tax=Deinobacterium chartae TaxID=521158 RepID=A0A841HYH0_9DEIO|nr:AMP-binding protein [Deinobacterium chartae]MBB6096962.1 acetyl-CoA synthetase [Deinobacterium chartae]
MSADAFLQARDYLLTHRLDAETARRDFRWPHLEAFNWALDHFDPLAHGNDQPALMVWTAGELERRSFEELRRASNRAANYLRSLGLARGDRVLLMLPNRVELWELMLGIMKIGAVVIPATTLLTEADLADRLERGQVRMVITEAAETAKFGAGDYLRVSLGATGGWHDWSEAARQSEDFVPDGVTRADDTLLLYFTSGTTSRPKLVEHTHASYPVGHLSTAYWIGLQPGDLHWNISSPGWAKHAWSSLFAPWNVGATVFAHGGRFDARETLELIVRYGITTLCAPPTVWRMLIQQDLGSYPVKLREVVGAGEPLNPEIIERVRAAWGLALRDGYGQTETTAQIGNPPGQQLRPGSMGKALPGYRVVLLDADDQEAEEGEIALDLAEGTRPLGLMRGYEGDPGRTQAALGGRYYRTGDVASRDKDGYLWYVGRADDVFKSSDYRISPFELESLLIEHPAVAEAAVVPSPDPLRLSVPKAYVVLVPGVPPGRDTALEILRFVRERAAPYKRVRRLEFTELPKTISGKIRRVELRGLEQQPGRNRGQWEFWEEDFEELRKDRT